MAETSPIETLILPAIADRLEAALDIAASKDAMDLLDAIAERLSQVQALVSAGLILRRDG